jgi:polyisoprenoid-binding protein YceI
MRKVLASFAIVTTLAAFSSWSHLHADPVPIKSGTITLSPQNTLIQFVCAHIAPNPDPRTGHFAKFSGQAQVDATAKALKSVSVEIDTNSITTQFDKLTAHLKSPDFFEARQYPTAKFESTKISPGQSGQAQITGKLTLHGVTKEISFPATVAFTSTGFTLNSDFSIERSQFGMNFGPDKVENKVDLKIAVGEKTPAK